MATLTDEVVDGLTDGTDDEEIVVLSVVAMDDDDALDAVLAEDELETAELEGDNRFGRARILAAAASATTWTVACKFPVGRSGCMEASTTKRLSVP